MSKEQKPNANQQIADGMSDGEITAVVKAHVPNKKHLSFFERQTANDLGKSLDSHGNIDLSEGSNSITVQANSNSKRVNPNVHASATDAFSQGVSEALDLEIAAKAVVVHTDLPEGSVARCARYCKTAGRTNCPTCQGHGFEAFKKALGAAIQKAQDTADLHKRLGK
jgi:hypothetical protein